MTGGSNPGLERYWRELVGAAMLGVPAAESPLPSPSAELAPYLAQLRGPGGLLEAAAVSWPLAAVLSPQVSASPGHGAGQLPLPLLPCPGPVQALLAEILDAPEAAHWPEMRQGLLREFLEGAARRGYRLPGWLLPRMLEALEPGFGQLPYLLEALEAGGQREFAAGNPAWRSLLETQLPGAVPDPGLLRNTRVPDSTRGQMMERLAAAREQPFAIWLARLARRLVHIAENAAGPVLEVRPLPPELHAERLPPALLPVLPPGLVPRDTLLRRAYGLLTLVHPADWFGPKTRQSLRGPNFAQALLRAEHPAGLAYAAGSALLRHGAAGWVRELTALYLSGEGAARATLDELRAARSLRGIVLRPGEIAHIASVLRTERQLGAGSGLLEVLAHLDPLPRELFGPAVVALLAGLEVASPVSRVPRAQELALEHCALRVQPLPGAAELARLDKAAERLRAQGWDGAAWQRAQSLLLFRRRLQDALREP